MIYLMVVVVILRRRSKLWRSASLFFPCYWVAFWPLGLSRYLSTKRSEFEWKTWLDFLQPFAETQTWYHGWMFDIRFPWWPQSRRHSSSLRVGRLCPQHWDCETAPANCQRSSGWVSFLFMRFYIKYLFYLINDLTGVRTNITNWRNGFIRSVAVHYYS